MSDLWQEDGFGSATGEAFEGDDWDEGEESLETELEEGFDELEELDEEWDGEDGAA